MSDYEELFLEIHGVRTRVLRGGSGPDLVYLHGAGGGEKWYAHHALLAEHFTVTAPDNPGWGGSETAEWMDEIQDYVLHHDSLMRALKIEHPVLVGHSLGGLMAAEFAATYPDRLAALVLVDAAGMPFEADDPVPDFFAEAGRGGIEFAQLLFHNMEAAAGFFNYPPTQEDMLRFYRELTSTARLLWDKWFDAKLPRRLPRINAKTAVLWGAHEKLFPVFLGEKYAAAIPGATLKLFEDCGHMVPYENPQAFIAEIVSLSRSQEALP